MPDYLALKAEIAKPAYAAMTDAQIATALMTNAVASEEAASGADVGKLWARRGVLGAARERSTRAALTVAQRVNAWSAIEMVAQDGFSGLNPNIPAQRTALEAFLDSLVTDTIMNAGDKAATLALLARTQTVAQSIGWQFVHPADVTAARTTI